MTSQDDKPKRWWPRFLVRTLAIVVTLVCCYAACWGPTKHRGVEDVLKHIAFNPRSTRHASALMPLVVTNDQVESHLGGADWGFATVVTFHRRYYFWFFGYVAKLPFEREL